MNNLELYSVQPEYVEYLSKYEKHIYWNAKPNQKFSRKYIGIVLKVGEFDYFAPLSSFKPKHLSMRESMDFIKVKNYAVINLNCMFPVPLMFRNRINFSTISDDKYRCLLLAEYREIKRNQSVIIKKAKQLYLYKLKHGTSTPLATRCNDFLKLEEISNQFLKDFCKEQRYL